jgi:hypothetical protein
MDVRHWNKTTYGLIGRMYQELGMPAGLPENRCCFRLAEAGR